MKSIIYNRNSLTLNDEYQFNYACHKLYFGPYSPRKKD